MYERHKPVILLFSFLSCYKNKENQPIKGDINEALEIRYGGVEAQTTSQRL